MNNRVVALLASVLWGAAMAVAHAGGNAAAQGAGASNVHFLSRGEAARALTEGDERGFYARLQLVEMRAKTGLALQGGDLDAARRDTMAAYAAATGDFTPEEQAALRDATDHLQPVLEAKAPLYARTPWSFIKVKPSIEGGLPHTRGDSIVLADQVLASLVRAHAKHAFDQASPVWLLLVHEQTHVVQRHHPELFVPLYTAVFGFQHAALPPAPEWVASTRMTNPDAPVSEWVFSVGQGAAEQWYLPEILVDNGEHPKMPEDFRVVALRVARQGTAWSYADDERPAATTDLESLREYVERFPVRDELFHPNEIAAGMVSYLLIDAPLPEPQSPLWAKTCEWASKALQ